MCKMAAEMTAQNAPTRFLVIRAGQLGDTVCASSIIEPLRRQFGGHIRIDWIARSGVGGVFEMDARIHTVFELRSRRLPIPLNWRKLDIAAGSWTRPYDYAINLELGTIFNDLMRLLRARHKIGMPYRFFAEPAESHAVDNLKLIYRSFLDPVEVGKASPSLQGLPPDRVRRKFGLHADYFVLVPTNSHLGRKGKPNYRAWPGMHWRRLMRLMSHYKIHGVLIGGKGEQAFFETLSPLPAQITSLVGRTRLPELIGLIQGARGVVATDTGPSHIAAAVDTPVISLIGPTNFKRTAPYKTRTNQVHIINDGLPCSPCYHTERLRKCRMNECMHAIHPARVLRTMLAVDTSESVGP